MRWRAHRLLFPALAAAGTVPVLAAAGLSGSGACADLDPLASGRAPRAPAEVIHHLQLSAADPVDMKLLCAAWAGASADFGRRRRPPSSARPAAPIRLLFVPRAGERMSLVARELARIHGARVPHEELAGFFGVAVFDAGLDARRALALIESPLLAHVEPDCDGPGFSMTAPVRSAATHAAATGAGAMPCWTRSARGSFPNDPCLPELWGHDLIGWDGSLATLSRSRVVAVLDSGMNCSHEDLAPNLWRPTFGLSAIRGRRGSATACDPGNPHGTQMAGTIAGAMNNGVGLAGVAPRARLLPLRISRVGQGELGSLADIARAIQRAGRSGAHVINVSAKWPVHSHIVYRAIREATEGSQGAQRLLVTGFIGSLGDRGFEEAYPSRYRCLPGVVAAVPLDVPHDPPRSALADVTAEADGRLGAPGVDIVVTTTENRTAGYDLEAAGGASSAAAYVSGAVALAWGTPPLQKCSAGEIRTLMFCRSKRSDSTRHRLVNVEFLSELSRIDRSSSCSSALEALGCRP